MTNKPSAPRLIQLILAGAASIATLALFSAAQPGTAQAATGPVQPQSQQISPVLTGGGGGRVVAVDDDTNPSSGDIFTQNAEDQSTASGAGTS